MTIKKCCNVDDHRYHAHSEVQRGDGLYGGLIVHNPELSEAVAHQYDRELLFLVGDWYHRQSDVVLATFADRTSEGNEVCCCSALNQKPTLT